MPSDTKDTNNYQQRLSTTAPPHATVVPTFHALRKLLDATTLHHIYKALLLKFSSVSFPDSCNSMEELLAWGRTNKIDAFNGQYIRAYIVLSLFKHFRCSSFVETGTWYGYTAYFVRKMFRTEVFSCEINKALFWINSISFAFTGGVHLFNMDSPIFLKRMGARHNPHMKNPMFYLDAHWYPYLPLPDELQAISRYFTQGIIVIDDFEVPGNLNFEPDRNIPLSVDINLVRRNFRRKPSTFKMYYPCYNPALEAQTSHRGICIIVFGQHQQLPARFPFDLLQEE